MTNSQRLATVRARLKNWLANHGPVSTSDTQPEQENSADSKYPILREAILIRDEFYCGRRFYLPGHHAVWFIEEDQLKIYRDEVELVCVLSGAEIDQMEDQPSEPSADIIKLPLPSQDDQRDEDEIRRAA